MNSTHKKMDVDVDDIGSALKNARSLSKKYHFGKGFKGLHKVDEIEARKKEIPNVVKEMIKGKKGGGPFGGGSLGKKKRTI